MLGKMQGLLAIEKDVKNMSMSNGGGELDATWVNIDSAEGESDAASDSDWSSPGDSPPGSPRSKLADGTCSGDFPVTADKAGNGGYAAAVEAKPAPSNPESSPAVVKAELPTAPATSGNGGEAKAAQPSPPNSPPTPFSVPAKVAAQRLEFDLKQDYYRAELDAVQELAKDRTFKVTLKAVGASAKPLQMFIGDAEGKALQQAFNGWKWQNQGCRRPLTYDFMKSVTEALGRKVGFVRVCASERGVFYARAHFEAGPGVARDVAAVSGVDSRPSDALNLALRFGAPIYMHRQLVTEIGS